MEEKCKMREISFSLFINTPLDKNVHQLLLLFSPVFVIGGIMLKFSLNKYTANSTL